jgi:hypothetical protein
MPTRQHAVFGTNARRTNASWHRQVAALLPRPHLQDAVQRVESEACKGAHLVALVVLVVDNVQPPANSSDAQQDRDQNR